MQIPHNRGSPEPHCTQHEDPQSSSPYPASLYQQQTLSSTPPYNNTYERPSPYGQGYGHPQYAPPPQHSYAPYGGPPPTGYGYNGPYQNHYAPPQQGRSPYQQQEPYPTPGPTPPAQYGAAAGYMNQGQEEQEHPPIPAPSSRPGDDRGVMGALAGGAAGAFAGHKANHGFLGALGGAYAGHKMQGAVHDHNKHKHDEKTNSPPQTLQHGHNYAGNFTASSTQMSQDKDYDLIVSCKGVDGVSRLSFISLNNCLTNSDGHIRWHQDGNFGGSARNGRLVDCGRTLEAELRNCGGNWVWDRIALDERVENNNGNLEFAS